MPVERQMRHFGVLSFTGTGHLNPILSLSRELKDRGHKVTVFEKRKIETRVRQAGLHFVPIGSNRPASKQKQLEVDNPGILSEISTLRLNINRIINDVEMFLKETPSALRQAGVDALIINEIALTGPTVAQMLGLPYFIISTSVPHNFGWNTYGGLSAYRYSQSWFSPIQDAFLEVSTLRMRGPIRRALDGFRMRAGLGPIREIQKMFPALAQITQLPECLDFPRAKLPDNFYYTGPFVSKTERLFVPFPWDRLDGRSIIYASLGTTRNVKPEIFRLIAEACRECGMQLVISLGDRFDPEMFSDLVGNPLVVRYAPQLELLKIARIVITHGGSNTVFEALMEGRPMIVIPIAHDQPAVAARLARMGIAEVLSAKKLSAKRLRLALRKISDNPSYLSAAMKLQAKIRVAGGVERAAEIVEDTLGRNTDHSSP